MADDNHNPADGPANPVVFFDLTLGGKAGISVVGLVGVI